MIESLRAFNDRISKIQDRVSLINEARINTRRIDIFYGIPTAVGVAGFLGGMSLLRNEAISPVIAYGILLTSISITYIPYMDIFGGARSLIRKDILEERANRLKVNLPKGPSERAIEIIVNVVSKGTPKDKQ